MRPLKIFLADLNYLNRWNRNSLYVPLNVGYIGSYVKKFFGSDVQVELFKDPHRFLARLREERPDIVGMSFYFWNTALNRAVVRQMREVLGPEPVVAWGGPSVDTDPGEQARLFERFPGVDAFITNEGELGFASLVKAVLNGRQDLWKQHIDGVIFRSGIELVKGREVGLTLDLAELPSPYLTGLLDPFLDGDLLPGIQTSRLCPYTCAFCVSGKTRGKLRAFPLDLVKEELEFIGRRFADRPHFTLHINDENFGILERDIEVADHVRDVSHRMGYPQSIHFYNDKRFTQISRQVLERVGHLTNNGMTLALQSENPDALKAINRRNLTEAQIDDAITWAASQNLTATTELIFGLPGDTLTSFKDTLNKSIQRGFDAVLCNTLFIMDGIEMNRPGYRKKFQLETRFRPVRNNYGRIGSDFCAEIEEVVVSSDRFTFNDFLAVRATSFMFYAVFTLRFYRFFFQYLRHLGIPLADFAHRFMTPEASVDLPEGYRKFATDFEGAARGELFDTEADLTGALRRVFEANGNEVGEAAQINVIFAARLIYQEASWVDEALLRTLRQFVDGEAVETLDTARDLLKLCRIERIQLTREGEAVSEPPPPLTLGYDVLAWRDDKFRKPLDRYAVPPRRITFSRHPRFARRFERFRRDFATASPENFYFNAMVMIKPRSDLLYQLSYEDQKVEQAPDSGLYESVPVVAGDPRTAEIAGRSVQIPAR